MDHTQLVGQLVGQYDLRELIGVGGMSAVYRAYQDSLNRQVAVKILSPQLAQQGDFLDRFAREAKLAAALEHPHVVPIYHYGVFGDEKLPFIVMRLLTGGTLATRIQESADGDAPTPTLGEISDLLKKLASALDYAHYLGVIHRDVKPSNVLFDVHENPYLVDFGIADLMHDSIDKAGQTVGTPMHMAPEQWKAEPLSPSMDLYALGIMTYVLIVGRAPFEAATPIEMMYKHLNEMPTPLHVVRSDVPPAVSTVVERAIAKDPSDRYDTASAYAWAFEQAIGGKIGTQHKHLFLSYSRRNTAEMHQVRDHLRVKMFDVWTDESLTAGTPAWETAIANAIENSAALVVLLSPDAKQSEWVNREVSYADAQEIPILPVLIDGDDRTAIPFRLVSTQRIDARDEFEAAMQQLVAAVHEQAIRLGS